MLIFIAILFFVFIPVNNMFLISQTFLLLQPIEVREALPEKETKVSRLGISYNAKEINPVIL